MNILNGQNIDGIIEVGDGDLFSGESKRLHEYMSSHRQKIPTMICLTNKATGEKEIFHNEILFGGRLSFISEIAKDQINIPASKRLPLNAANVLNSNPNEALTPAEWNARSVCLFGIGSGGANIGGTLSSPHPDEVKLERMLPLRCRKLNEDLVIGGSRDDYGLRTKSTFDEEGTDTQFYAYWAKKVQSVKLIVSRNNADYNPTYSNSGLAEFSDDDKNPVPITNTLISAVYTLDMAKEDLLEYYQETGTLADNSGFSEIAMINALQREVTDDKGQKYMDYVGAEIFSRFTLSTRPTDPSSKGYKIDYAIGS